MSSDLLLLARGVRKAYPSSRKPFTLFVNALLGRPLPPSDSVEVLRDIDLEVRRGETVGIMGRNGAGKTTLLSILGGVLEPTGGTVERHGRIATLLGLSAGFNGYLSGRENAFQFASVQGIPRRSAAERMAKIEAFADIGRYFEMPLRTYSSGMQARLAFACAIHVDADLIIIDETLAVGDAAFRMKCYDRINAMKRAGQTFLLVSHSPNLVSNYCTRGVVIEQGCKRFDGAVFEAVEEYKRLRTVSMDADTVRGETAAYPTHDGVLDESVVLEDIRLVQLPMEMRRVRVEASIRATRTVSHPVVNFGVRDQFGITVCAYNGTEAPEPFSALQPGESRPLVFELRKNLLPGRYFFSAMLGETIGDAYRPLSLYQNVVHFDVLGRSHLTGIADLDMTLQVAPT
jgi:ABC-type polysaccharide/polyol phosphate transport system ATPase subunit